MQEFSVGDQVIYTSGRFGCDVTNPLHKDYPNVTGEIIDIRRKRSRGDLNIKVYWSTDTKNEYDKEDLQHVNEYIKQKSQLKI